MALPGPFSGRETALEAVTAAALSYGRFCQPQSFYWLNYITLARILRAMGTRPRNAT